MAKFQPHQGISTLVNHACEGEHSLLAHNMPLYQTSTFDFEDVASGAARFKGEQDGYIYTRLDNPNNRLTAQKIAVLEGLDLLRADPDKPVEEIVAGQLFSSGMAAITAAILAAVEPGQALIAQEAVYSATYNFLEEVACQYGIDIVWLPDPSPEAWEAAFAAHPQARLAYAETPSNPGLTLVDLQAVAQIAHGHSAWLMTDNTFATPYCQRPLSLGADVVVHSTTKYLSGHGLVIGGCAVSPHLDYMHGPLHRQLKIFGGAASPFDAWMTNIGLKTFEVRMQRHCQNAQQIARFLSDHPAVAQVYYPGLESNPQFALAQRQMPGFGGMISFELKGGLEAGASLMDRVKVCTLAVSLGATDTLVEHPASMTHSTVSREERLKCGITDGLVRMSVGIENVEDLVEDLDQALG